MTFTEEEREALSILEGYLYLKINKLLLIHSKISGSNVKSMRELLKFVPNTERKKFLNEIKNTVKNNNTVLELIDSNCKKINILDEPNHRSGSAMVPLFVYSLGDEMSDISNTVKNYNEPLFKKMLKYDECAFLVTNSSFQKFIKNAKYYGIPTDDNHKLQWVMPKDSAEKITSNIKKLKTVKGKKKEYADSLGLPDKNLEDEISFYYILIDVKRFKLLREITKKISLLLPNKNVPGANEFWVPGGFTSGGVPEIVLNNCPRMKPYTIKEEQIYF